MALVLCPLVVGVVPAEVMVEVEVGWLVGFDV